MTLWFSLMIPIYDHHHPDLPDPDPDHPDHPDHPDPHLHDLILCSLCSEGLPGKLEEPSLSSNAHSAISSAL